MLNAVDVIGTSHLEVGRVHGLDADGRPLVRMSREGRETVEPAWIAVSLSRSELEELARSGDLVLVSRPEGFGGRCVVLGVVRDRALPDAALPREVVLEASERLVVRCGAARIVLHGDGRYEVHAERISQRARGVHAIKGAAVRIN